MPDLGAQRQRLTRPLVLRNAVHGLLERLVADARQWLLARDLVALGEEPIVETDLENSDESATSRSDLMTGPSFSLASVL